MRTFDDSIVYTKEFLRVGLMVTTSREMTADRIVELPKSERRAFKVEDSIIEGYSSFIRKLNDPAFEESVNKWTMSRDGGYELSVLLLSHAPQPYWMDGNQEALGIPASVELDAVTVRYSRLALDALQQRTKVRVPVWLRHAVESLRPGENRLPKSVFERAA